ncbi:MAG: hypothetical protein PVH29_11220 [Candidatus Zixiibacteriota bacterium]|jgi:hypothetical protein
MKKVAIVAALTVAVGASAFAALGDVVSSFASPSSSPYAVACCTSYIYVYCNTSPYNVYTCTPSGSVVSSWASPFGSHTRGLGYEYGDYLWLGYYGSNAFVAKVNAANGSVISSFEVHGVHTMYGGVACQGNPGSPGIASVICNDYLPYRACRSTTSGSLINSFEYPSSTSFRDPGWDYGNDVIWWGHNTSTNPYMYAYTTMGSLKASFAAPGSYPYGCDYYDGYLWICRNASPYYVYQVDCPGTVTIVPASLGRVKAMYR